MVPGETRRRWVTFDCYGTLVDWDRGMAQAIESVASGQARRLLARYHQLEPQVEAERPFRRYRAVLAESLRRAAAQEGVPLPLGGEAVLADTLPTWPAFEDVGPALLALRGAGWKLAILSNVDRDLIAGTLTRIPVSFDVVVTAEDVQAYKPALAHFRHFQESARVGISDWVHVARSYFHDIVPASRIGIRRVWINRGGDRDDPSVASAVLADLRRLPATLDALA